MALADSIYVQYTINVVTNGRKEMKAKGSESVIRISAFDMWMAKQHVGKSDMADRVKLLRIQGYHNVAAMVIALANAEKRKAGAQ